MEENDKGKGGEEVKKDTPPLQIDPKWYVRYPTSLQRRAAERTQLPRCTQDVLSTHQERRRPSRFLRGLQEGGGRV